MGNTQILTKFLKGKIFLYQPSKGYRFSLDAPLLADFIEIGKNHVSLEIGSGCGIIPIILVIREKSGKKIYSIEIQEELFKLAIKNVKLNGVSEKVEILKGDARKIVNKFPECFDVVFTNPPYNLIESRRISDNVEKIIACNEIFLKLEDIFKIAFTSLKEKGSLFMIYPFERKDEVLKVSRRYKFSIKKFKKVFSIKGARQPFLILFHFKKGEKCHAIEEKEIYIYEEGKEYSKSFEKIIS